MKKTFIALASVTALTTLVEPSAFANSHKVENGENLATLSEKYGTSVSDLKALNNITSDVTVGQNIKVLKDNVYVVQEGDTLNKISEKFDVSVSDLKEWNDLSSDVIVVGTSLKVSGEEVEVEENAQVEEAGATAEPTSVTVLAPSTASSSATTHTHSEEQHAYSTQSYVNEVAYHQPEVRTSWNNQGHEATYTTTPVSSNHSHVGGGDNLYTSGQCTYYAFSKRPDLGNTWGNANNWANAASQAGYKVNNNPAAGSILQSTAGGYGHVAYVDKVNSDGSIQVSEMNYQGVGVVSSRTISASAAKSYNYIH
ncbi:LysM peptidoglycan-binding domain-containing protein [Mammaliicoccus sp. Dog046]|uniref:LysM peptidoglycan-binding domain-containing protein n=1 Tax=Mammaliicoccus sp. Dog046 TaxID=3034233 RepID=UPI002B260CC3|nr:LysM peptidoglycan-binding domain-containing protein [Mammaliicoccus sp. Dog046]WQK84997.1 LysM peptidoglycan-binding domain-containing protein [Mammaliicoccus sp. Dog046]